MKLWIAALVVIVLGAGWYFYSRNPQMAENSTSSNTQPVGSQPGASQVVNESMIGKWQSQSEAKYQIEFTSDNQRVDWYDGKEVSHGLFVVFTKANAPKIISTPLDETSVYMQTTMTGAQSDTQNYKINLSADASTLTLTYLDRGGVTTYTRIK